MEGFYLLLLVWWPQDGCLFPTLRVFALSRKKEGLRDSKDWKRRLGTTLEAAKQNFDLSLYLTSLKHMSTFAVFWESKDFTEIPSYLKWNMNKFGKEKGEHKFPEHPAVPATLPTPLSEPLLLHTGHVWPFPNYWAEPKHCIPDLHVLVEALRLSGRVASWAFLCDRPVWRHLAETTFFINSINRNFGGTSVCQILL